MPVRTLRLLALLLAFVLVGAACGGSDDGGEGGNGDATVQNGDGGGSGDGNGGAVDPDDLPDEIPDIPGLSDECEALAGFYLGVAQIFAGGFGNAEDLFDSAQSDLPSSLDEDLDVLFGALTQYSEALDELGIDLADPTGLASLPQDQLDAFEAATEALSAPEVEQAFDNLQTYAEDECDTFGP